MWATQKPDVYAGDNCTQHRPRWEAGAEGDKGGVDTCILLTLDAACFPPGTKVVVSEPECPHCGMVPDRGDLVAMKDREGNTITERKWTCCDEMNWRAWADDEFC